MTVKDTVKKAILTLETLCESYKKDPLEKLEDLEETVTHLSHEVQNLNLASEATLKTELNTLQSALVKLSSVLKERQENIERQVHEIHLHQQALYAYAKVANNNLGSFV
jgi:chromosome segregation ATPase